MLCSAPLLDGLDPQDVAALLPAFRFATVDVDQELITQGESGAAQVAAGHAGPLGWKPALNAFAITFEGRIVPSQPTNQDQLHRRSDTPGAAAGKSERAIMKQTGHKSLPMVRRYIREGVVMSSHCRFAVA